jgi:uncharacterized protein (DUF433 family)
MWTSVEPWQLSQLQRLAILDPERVESLLNHLYAVEPTLLGELAVSAVDQEELSVSQCADLTGLSEEQVEAQLLTHRSRAMRSEAAVVIDPERHIARLAKGGVAVWEVVRVFRQHGTIAGLVDTFPSLSRSEMMAALAYAEKNLEEIEVQIERYEQVRQRKQAEYPFVR